MKKKSNPQSGKILKHGNPLGLSDEMDVDQRADEVARIEGHRKTSDDDRRHAEVELNGEAVPLGVDDDIEGSGSLSRDPSDPPSDAGHQIPNVEAEDEQFAAERLVAEGVAEAEYDQMLAARKRRHS